MTQELDISTETTRLGWRYPTFTQKYIKNVRVCISKTISKKPKDILKTS
jgi:hypothetical protein